MKFFMPVAAAVACLMIVSGLALTGSFSTFTLLGADQDYGCEGCNLLVITIDTLRADHVSSYGHAGETTPSMDAVAREGVRFSNAFCQIPHTPPSHWTIFTGLYPHEHGRFSPADNGTGLLSLPEILGEEGYVTSAFISSKMLKGFREEFTHFDTSLNRAGKVSVRRGARDTTASVLSWMEDLENLDDEPFFMWVHYYDPHSPYEPPGEHNLFNYSDVAFYSGEEYSREGFSRGRTIRGDIEAYDGEIRYSDSGIGEILEELKRLELDDDTLVVILSDHGECFGEHSFSDFGYDNDRPCFFHGRTLYDEEIHVPLIVRNPRSGVRGKVVEDVVETTDLVPTILEVLGVSSDAGFSGSSLVPLIEGKGRSKGFAFSQLKPRDDRDLSFSVRTSDRKLVRVIPSNVGLEEDILEQEEGMEPVPGGEEPGIVYESREMLFDVTSGEKEDIMDSEPGVAKAMHDMLREMISSGTLPGAGTTDEETERLLRSLGYIA